MRELFTIITVEFSTHIENTRHYIIFSLLNLHVLGKKHFNSLLTILNQLKKRLNKIKVG